MTLRYLNKSIFYKNQNIAVVIYFYRFPVYYLKVYLHLLLKTFNCLSIISVHIAKLLQMQVCQSFISPFRTYFQQVMYVTTHNYWNGILHYSKNQSYFMWDILTRRSYFDDYDFHLHRFRPFVLKFWETQPATATVTCIIDACIFNINAYIEKRKQLNGNINSEIARFISIAIELKVKCALRKQNDY